MGVARAFATGPRPKRSIVLIWHAGEEAGLLGSRYNADFPIVPLDKVQAVLNMDMVGRDDCDNLEGDYTNSVFLVGDDRISTDLHNVIVQANQAMTKPLTLDYEMNDPADPEGVYTRSDHSATPARAFRWRSSRPASIPITTGSAIRWRRSCSPRWRALAS